MNRQLSAPQETAAFILSAPLPRHTRTFFKLSPTHAFLTTRLVFSLPDDHTGLSTVHLEAFMSRARA